MSLKIVYKDDNEESNAAVNEGLNNSSSENGISIQTQNFHHNRSQVNSDASNANSEANSRLQLSFSERSSNSSLRHRRNSSIARSTLNLTNSQINTATNANSEDEINLSACPDSVPNFSGPTETVSNYRNDPNVYSSGLELTSSSEINGNYGNGEQFINPNMYFFRNSHASSESFPVSSQESAGALNLGYDDRVVRAGGENAPQPTESSGRHRSRNLFGSSSSDLSMITAFENFNLVSDNSSIATDDILDEISSFIMSESSDATTSASDSSSDSTDDASFSGILPTIESMTDRLTTALEALQSTMSCEGGSGQADVMSDQMINNFNRLRRRSLQTAENAAETVRNMNSFLSSYQANEESDGSRGYAQMSSISERLRNVSNSLTSALQAIQTEMNRSSAPEGVSARQSNAERVGSSRRKAGCKAEKPVKSKSSEEKDRQGPKKPAVIKCPVCFKTYDDLMACDSHLVHGRCGHVICNSCADILKNERLIRCPVCRKRLKSLGGNPFKRVYLATE